MTSGTPSYDEPNAITRRHLFTQTAGGLGAAALATLLGPRRMGAAAPFDRPSPSSLPHFAPRAKRVIYLFQSGGPSHIDLFDYKPKLRDFHRQELPNSVRMGQRLTDMTSDQSSFPCVAPGFQFRPHGECGRWLSETLPFTGQVVDDLCVIKSVHTEAINHDPAITFILTGTQQLGKPGIGAWLSYGLGSTNHNLPTFMVLISQGSGQKVSQPLFSRLWSSGFLPAAHQGVKLRSGKDPVLYLSNPPGIDAAASRRTLRALVQLNRRTQDEYGDPETSARIAQYEMAFRMQTSVPELVDLSDEPESTFEMYGPDARKPGTYAANCLLARRMAERGVRFVQLFHRGWDQHGNLPKAIRAQSQDTDQASAALVKDLKQRGMLDETLVIWGGEFGRTVFCQGELAPDNYGRDHHGRCFTIWMAGGGIRGGMEYGRTDDYCYNIVENGVHINDINATILHCLGIDHMRFTYRYQGLDQRLTGVEPVQIVKELLA